MTLNELVVRVHEGETGAAPGAQQLAELAGLAADYRADQGSEWLRAALEAVLGGGAMARPAFYQPTNFEIDGYLAEVAALLGWDGAFEGETVELRFPRLGAHVHISHEAYAPELGAHGSSYHVTRLAG